MFGYVLPPLGALPERERERFRGLYCGLCHTLADRYGLRARFILNYDFTFLAMLLSDGTEPATQTGRCVAHLCRGRCYQCSNPALELAADESVILTYWQLQDGVSDHGMIRRIPYYAAAAALKTAYHAAAARRPAFDAATRAQLQALHVLEAQRCDSMDAAADAFAVLLRAAAEEAEGENRRRVLRQMLYHLGRWIYLVDAADDLKQDLAQGAYNPLALRFSGTDGILCDEERRQFSQSLDHSVHMMTTAYELADFGCWSTILEAVLYRGLFQVARSVLDGTFHKRQPNKKEKIVEDTTA